MKYSRIVEAIASECWAILPSKLEEIIAVLEARMNGVQADAHKIAEIEAARRRPVRKGRVAVLPLFGAISHRANSVQSSFGTSAETYGRDFDDLMASPEVGGIILDVDSPGGSVSGIPELAEKIRGARGQGKQIVAVANAGAFSAAYWIATAADELIVTPSGMVGSVGVVSTHVDQSKALEDQGLKVTYITAGKYKVEGNATEPLEAEALAELQANVDRYYGMFVDALAKNRDTTAAKVRRDFGEGRIVSPKQAAENNMADRVATLEQVISEMTGTVQPRRRGSRASIERERLNLADITY